MRRKLTRYLTRLQRSTWSRSLVRIPGVRPTYRRLKAIIEPDIPSSITKIEFAGDVLFIDPSDHIGKELYLYGEYEPGIGEIITEHLTEGATAVDVGAHYGNHTITMREAVGPTGEVLAIEPNSTVNSLLKQTIEARGHQNVELLDVAASDQKTTGWLNIPKETQRDLSRINVGNFNAHSTDQQRVEMHPLNEIFNQRELSSIDLLKIDAEGHELQILRGLSDSIDDVKCLILEVHENDLSEDQLLELSKRLKLFSELSVVEPTYPLRTTKVSRAMEIQYSPGRHLLCQ